MRIPVVAKKVDQFAVGAADVNSLAKLSNLLQSDLSLQCKIEVALVPTDTAANVAQSQLPAFVRRKDISAIFVIGSPMVNPLADPISEKILGSSQPPAKFRWANKFPGSLLSDPVAWPSGQCLALPSGTLFPRDPDDSIRSAVRKGNRQLKDYGLLLMSCEKRPPLVLAAGHDGVGTEGCLEILHSYSEISDRLKHAQMRNGKSLRCPTAAVQLLKQIGRVAVRPCCQNSTFGESQIRTIMRLLSSGKENPESTPSCKMHFTERSPSCNSTSSRFAKMVRTKTDIGKKGLGFGTSDHANRQSTKSISSAYSHRLETSVRRIG